MLLLYHPFKASAVAFYNLYFSFTDSNFTVLGSRLQPSLCSQGQQAAIFSYKLKISSKESYNMQYKIILYLLKCPCNVGKATHLFKQSIGEHKSSTRCSDMNSPEACHFHIHSYLISSLGVQISRLFFIEEAMLTGGYVRESFCRFISLTHHKHLVLELQLPTYGH